MSDIEPQSEVNASKPESNVSDSPPESKVAPAALCEHIMASGKRCGSPALSGQTKCYYHHNLEYRLPYGRLMFVEGKTNPAPGEWPIHEFPVPDLEDAAAIQIGFMQALHGVCNGSLPPQRAKLVLSALHGASANLNRLQECLAACGHALQKKAPTGVKRAPRRRKAEKPLLAGSNAGR